MIIFEPQVTYSRKEIPSIGLNSAEDTYKFIQSIPYDPTVENFGVIFLNRKNQYLGAKLLFKGGISSTTCDVKIILKECLLMNCCSAFIVFHNHPSGDPAPSSADTRATRKIRESAELLDLVLIDHIVAGEKDNDPADLGYYSYREAGLI